MSEEEAIIIACNIHGCVFRGTPEDLVDHVLAMKQPATVMDLEAPWAYHNHKAHGTP